MLSPISDTGHLVRARNRPARFELALIFLNVGTYAFACVSLFATLSS